MSFRIYLSSAVATVIITQKSSIRNQIPSFMFWSLFHCSSIICSFQTSRAHYFTGFRKSIKTQLFRKIFGGGESIAFSCPKYLGVLYIYVTFFFYKFFFALLLFQSFLDVICSNLWVLSGMVATATKYIFISCSVLLKVDKGCLTGDTNSMNMNFYLCINI